MRKFLLVLSIVVLFCGCSKDDGISANDLFGKWSVEYQTTIYSLQHILGIEIMKNDECKVYLVWPDEDNHIVTLHQECDYQLSGNQIFIHDKKDKEIYYNITINDLKDDAIRCKWYYTHVDTKGKKTTGLTLDCIMKRRSD